MSADPARSRLLRGGLILGAIAACGGGAAVALNEPLIALAAAGVGVAVMFVLIAQAKREDKS